MRIAFKVTLGPFWSWDHGQRIKAEARFVFICWCVTLYASWETYLVIQFRSVNNSEVFRETQSVLNRIKKKEKKDENILKYRDK